MKRYFFFNFCCYIIFLIAYSMFLGNIFYRENKDVRIQVTDLIGLISGVKDQIVFPDSEILSNSNGEVVFPGGAGKQSNGGIFFPDDSKGPGNDFTAEVDRDPNADTIDLSQHLEDAVESVKNTTEAFAGCLMSGVPTVTCSLEVLLLLMVGLLLVQEGIQCFALGIKRYILEWENLLELLAIFLATAGLFLQHDMQVLMWVSAPGICFAYLEFIFLMGRYPFIGGSISLMFYSILSHLFRSLINFVVLVVGFGFGFFIISNGKAGDHFENPPKAILKTLIMALGEFEFDDLYRDPIQMK